ncbi:MAG: branched-chain-amino-acid transaminase [Fimbriimonadaceae bacterium]|nr:branched-chain-amino-acid transaminase [Fimbriimonadaceae bacterium]QYK59290.1 MAG: branched-chain-amino-acid transaminase [Fimbriimonadaceae bacterium]
MPKLVWLNGCLSPIEDATTSVADHAHLYGDGLFEGIRIYGRRVFKLDEHLDRLYHGCSYLGYAMTLSKAQVRDIVLDVCRKADISDGYIRLNVTRGSGLGLDPRAVKTDPNVMVMISTLALYPPEAYETGLEVVTTSFRVFPPDALDPRLKCIGRYAANILAKAEANKAGAGEGLMLNTHGNVAECTGDNIFLVKDGRLRTPHPSSGILKGITRDTVLALAQKKGIETVEDTVTRFDIFCADECFLTGTAAEVIPMVRLDGQPIHDGKPGPVTKALMADFRNETLTGVPFDH